MKSIIIVVIFVFAARVAAFAQCDKKLILTSSTTEYLDSNSVVQKSVAEKSTITIDKSASITIAPGNDHQMKGTISKNDCNWKVPFKEGKSIIKAAITDGSGDVNNATLTLEGKDGKITLVLVVAEMPGKKIRVPIDTFQEDK